MKMKKVNLRNRYGYDTKMYQKNDCWYFNCEEKDNWRMRMNTMTTYSMIDPSGGPQVSIRTKLNDYHPNLPDEQIEQIEYDSIERAFKITTL